MSYFDKSFYLSSFMEQQNLNDENELCLQAKNHPELIHGVDYQKFSEKYKPKGWFGRKIIAIPAAVWAITIKTVYHLVKAILLGIPMAPFEKGKYFKAQLFHIGRDFQEAFGRAISFLNDRYGLYHIQESQFYKSCYTCSYSAVRGNPSQPNPVPNPAPDQKTSIPNNLAEAEKMYPFALSSEIKKSEEKLSKLSEEDFKKTIVYFSDEQYSIIPAVHINAIDYNSITETEIQHLFPMGILESEKSKEKLGKLSPENFKLLVKKFDHDYFSIIPKNHVDHIDYTNLTKSQFTYLFPYHFFAAGSEEEQTREKLAQLSVDNFKKVVSKFDDKHFFLVSNDHVDHIDYTNLTKSQCEYLFPYSSLEEERTREKLTRLSVDNFKKVMSKFNDALFAYIPPRHLNTLIESFDLKLFQFIYVFGSGDLEKTEKKFEALTEENFKKIIPKFNYDSFFAIPNKHLNTLVSCSNLTKLEFKRVFPLGNAYKERQTREKLALLSPENFKKSVGQFEDEHFGLVPKNHLNNIDKKSLTGTQSRFYKIAIANNS